MLKAQIQYNNFTFETDFSKPIDISVPVAREQNGPNAFYLKHADYETVEAGGFVGNVRRGGSCNVENIYFSPHGNGTHTECAGHIAGEQIFITDVLTQSIFPAQLISVQITENKITAEAISAAFTENIYGAKAVVIRTLPNSEEKKTQNYSGKNPPYFAASAIDYLNSLGIEHILTDLPSLDKEDDGKLLAHNAFFKEAGAWNLHKTVTEMVFVPGEVQDGFYWLNLQIAPFQSDASPSKPLLFQSKKI